MTAVPNSYWPRFGLMEGKIFVVTNASDKRNKCLLHKEWGSSITVSAVSNHLLVSCQQCIVWWSCQCHLRFVFYIICKSATFLRDLTFHIEFQSRSMIFGEVTNNRDQYHVNLQEGGKNVNLRVQAIDFQINYRCKYRWRTWKSSNRGPEICRCSSHPQYLFSSPFSSNTRTMTIRPYVHTSDA